MMPVNPSGLGSRTGSGSAVARRRRMAQQLLHRPTIDTEPPHTCNLAVPEERGYVHLRMRQRSGHMAWVGHVFLNHE